MEGKLLLNEIFFFLLAATIASFPFFINNYFIIALLICSLSILIQKQQRLKIFSQFFLFPLLFIVLLIGLFYSENLIEGIKIVERHLALLAIPPLLIVSKQLSQQQKDQIFNIFVISTGLISAYCLVFTYYEYLISGTLYPTGQTGHFIYNRFMHHRLSAAINFHAIYFSFYISFSAISIIYKLLFTNIQDKILKISFLILLPLFIVMIYLLKSSLFAFALPLCVIILLFLRLKVHLKKPMVLMLFLASIFLISISSFYGIKSKLGSFAIYTDYSESYSNPLSIRIGIWRSALNGIEENPFWGVGTGDAQTELIEQYKKIDFSIGLSDNFNAHNMYLQYWLSNGIAGLLLFLAIFIFLIFVSIRNHNHLFLCLLLLFSLFSFTESTMLREKGLLFFVFFSSLFYWNPKLWISEKSKI